MQLSICQFIDQLHSNFSVLKMELFTVTFVCLIGRSGCNISVCGICKLRISTIVLVKT